ncbi:MAG: VOC family protein [Cyclobacteriaceae bacterium]|nr:VOC family protein [Cyclobacteriaceae bacterium]MDH4296584.1 VOC family protein [Cyclobacteriaceae bacterium]MDH5248851.1 VOC family protein [Cyclobacteriaceae bacterium]
MQSKKKSNIKQAVPFFWVSDMNVSIQYYTEGLGFEMTNKWVDHEKVRWCWLQHGGAALMLQEFWSQGQHTNVPEGKVGEGISIYFICEDALAFYNEVHKRGIPASQPVVRNSLWTTSLSDPDGYKLVFESATDVPEETAYAAPAGKVTGV